MYYQRTLAAERQLSGIGLHSGRPVSLILKPSAAGTGIVFVRSDLDGFEIPATIDCLRRAHYATVLEHEGRRVSTVEHLLAAVYALGVDNVRIELDGEEVPIVDGSASAFVSMIRSAGLVPQEAPRQYLVMAKPLEISDGEKQIAVYPCREYRVTYAIDFDHPKLGFQELTASPWGVDAFDRMLAPARTFVLEREVEALRRAGLAQGGSLDNAVVVGDEGLLNGPLRFQDEFVRHKMLDLTGDLALLEHPLRGHVVAFRAGHDMHTLLVRRLLARPDTWFVSPWPSGEPVSEEWLVSPEVGASQPA
jgi:UDP-3-O-[3-hydroxymyristoyl] N-acetylglucosamine deacetylase